VQELAEQITHNKNIVAQLQHQASLLKEHAFHNVSGYALRRFNVDLSQETFDSELERTNALILIENQTLQHENKQLGTLLKEYEQTMETVMSKFRNHANAAVQHEMTLTGHYETLLQSRETTTANAELANSAHVTASLQRLQQNLRLLLRSLHGEETENWQDDEGKSLEELGGFLEDDAREDWALEREREITRIEKENEELRRILGIDNENAQKLGLNEDDVGEHRPLIASLRAAIAHSRPPEVWRPASPSPAQPFGTAPGPMSGNVGPQGPQTMQLQRAGETAQPGMRTAGTIRRPAMFGQRARGNGTPLWTFQPHQDRQWREVHNGGGSGLDLAG